VVVIVIKVYIHSLLMIIHFRRDKYDAEYSTSTTQLSACAENNIRIPFQIRYMDQQGRMDSGELKLT